jgi:hypothetical protein
VAQHLRHVRSPQGAQGQLPFIEDAGVRIPDTSLIIDHLVRTRVDPDTGLDVSQRAIAPLAQRTLEEHYVFILAYTHLVRDEGSSTRVPGSTQCRRSSARWSAVSARRQIKKILWSQGPLRHAHEHILESALRFGNEPTIHHWRGSWRSVCRRGTGRSSQAASRQRPHSSSWKYAFHPPLNLLGGGRRVETRTCS